jgi:hypothetical protein
MNPKAGTKEPDAAQCPPGFSVRQGGTVDIPVPVTSLDAVTGVDTTSDLKLTWAKQRDDGSIYVPVTAIHGAPSGDGDFGRGRRLIRIETTVDGQIVTRHVLVTVSHIRVSSPTASFPNGDAIVQDVDDGFQGTLDAPYATIQRAIMKAAKGDTIELSHFDAGPLPEPCSMPLGATITVPAGTTLIGGDMLPTPLPMAVTLEGDANLQNLELRGNRLVIDTAGSNVQIFDSTLHCGVTVGSAADINPNTNMPTKLLISGSASNVWNDLHFDNNLKVDAAGAQVTLQDGVNVVTTATQMDSSSPSVGQPVDTIVFDGDQQTLNVLGAHIENSSGSAGIRITKSARVYLEGADVTGPLIVEDPSSSVQISTSVFQGPSTAVEFHGAGMTVTGTTFNADGIIQDNPGSVVTVNAMTAKAFKSFGYWLKDGTAAISNSEFHTAARVLSQTGPWALLNDAPAGSAGHITSSASTYDVMPPPSPCDIAGAPWDPNELPGLYNISAPSPMRAIRISFY